MNRLPLCLVALTVALGCVVRATVPAASADEPLRGAVEDLIDTFGSAYPNGQSYLVRLDRLEGQLEKATGRRAARLRAKITCDTNRTPRLSGTGGTT